jgi:hypothetical protein
MLRDSAGALRAAGAGDGPREGEDEEVINDNLGPFEEAE